MPVRALAAASLVALAALLPAKPLAAEGEAPPEKNWSLTLGAWGAVTRYDVLGLQHGLGALESEDGKDLLEGDFDTWGGSALLRIRWLDVGLLYEGTFLADQTDSAVLTPLVGVALGLGRHARLDLLAELGGHKISNIGLSGEFTVSDPKSVWLPYVGVRPTLSLRLPVGPVRLVLSLAPFARWDVVQKDVTVEVSDGTTTTDNTYEVGGTTFGVAVGAGVEL
jgi:hypothetical protein